MYNNEFHVDTTELIGGETIGIGILEISSIPHISILNKNANENDSFENKVKEAFSSLLTELYQSYRLTWNNEGLHKDISFELMWNTQSVTNQPYKAKIEFYLIIRAIDNSPVLVTETITALFRICKATLDLQKYDYKSVSYDKFVLHLTAIEGQSIRAIVKDERMENLHNSIRPDCFAFDIFPNNGQDLSRIVNSLIDYPDCSISFQLVPTEFSNTEIAAIGEITQVLTTLSKGVMEQGVGNVSFSSAEKLAEIYKYYSQNKHNALFNFNIVIYGNSQAVNGISSRVYGQLSTAAEKTASLKYIELNTDEIQRSTNFYPLPWLINETLINTNRNRYIWDNRTDLSNLYRLPYIITAEEASEFFRLPIGNNNIAAGLHVNESEKASRTYSDNIINGGDIEVGKIKSSTNKDTIGFLLNDLTKHMLIVGTPGSGKTTFSIGMLERLWKNHQIPFLVIEPAKNEYRALVRRIPSLQIFTPGKNSISPFAFNPFSLPTNVKLETYKSTLKTAFSAAVSMSTPLDKIFEESINNCYSDFHWLDSYTSADKGETFNISDFIKCFEKTFEEIGYTGDAKNIGRAGVVRLNSLVNLFDNYFSVPIEDILKKPTVIELAAIENSEQKSLIIALLLLSILAYVNSNYSGQGNLQNVILLEEAHVLLDADANTMQGEANPSAIAQGLIKRMLAEIRAYGVGIIVADQSPRKVSSDIVALTDIKLSFRVVEAMDKQIIADSTNMSDSQLQRLSKFKPGEAFLYFNKLGEPEEVKTDNYRKDNNIDLTISDNEISSLSTYWRDKQKKLRPYPECIYIKHCVAGCDFEKRALAKEISRRIFVKNFRKDTKNYQEAKAVFSKITKLSQSEANDILVDKRTVSCIKLQLLRKIKYKSKIDIPAKTVRATLENA